MTSLCHLGDRNTISNWIPRRGTDEAAMSQHDAQARQASGDCRASAASNRGQTS